MLSKGHTGALWSSNSGAHPCIAVLAATTPSGQTGTELKNRNDFNNWSSPRVDKINNRKPKADHKEGQLLPAKIPKTPNSKQLATSRTDDGSEIFTDTRAHQPLDRDRPEYFESEGLNKIPVNAVKPHPLGFNKAPSTSSLLKASVLQQQARQEQAASRGQCRPRSPHGSLHTSQTSKRKAGVKQTTTEAHHVFSPTTTPRSVDTSGQGSSAQPLSVCVRSLQPDSLLSADLDSESIPPKASVHNSHASSCSDRVSLEDIDAVSNTGKSKGQKLKPKDCVIKLDGQAVEADTKPGRFRDRKLSFDPVTGQITPFYKEPCQEGVVRLCYKPESQCSEQLKQNALVPPSPFQQTDWKELSRSEIIQSYLSQQSNVLASSGAHTPGAHFFMTEFLKKEEHQSNANQTHTLAPAVPTRDLPGISREIIIEDLNRLHTQHWSGVNGCYDTNGNWFDWTECISLDPHGDESRLNILPYVCLDWNCGFRSGICMLPSLNKETASLVWRHFSVRCCFAPLVKVNVLPAWLCWAQGCNLSFSSLC